MPFDLFAVCSHSLIVLICISSDTGMLSHCLVDFVEAIHATIWTLVVQIVLALELCWLHGLQLHFFNSTQVMLSPNRLWLVLVNV